MEKKISMFLMNQKGFYVLSQFLKHFPATLLESVIGARDEAVEKDYQPEIKALCEQHQIPYYDRQDQFTVKAPYSFAIGWRWLIQQASKLITLHDSLLPKYRGYNPLVTALINGDSEAGVTAVFATEKCDEGDVIAQSRIPLAYPIKIQKAIDDITFSYFDLVKSICELIFSNKPLPATPQNKNNISYSLWRDELDYHIQWQQDAETLKRFIDAVGHPYRGAYSWMENEKIRIIDAEIFPDVAITNRTPGKIIFLEKGLPVVVCGKGLLKLTHVVNETQDSLLPLGKFRVRFT